ncbi:MAG: heterodisulfide reductase, partial [Phascolarctobacterium sp.]
MAVDEKQLTEDILRLAATDVRRCMQCGRCSANCEAASKMDLLPHRVVWDLNSGYASELLEADAGGIGPERLDELIRMAEDYAALS